MKINIHFRNIIEKTIGYSALRILKREQMRAVKNNKKYKNLYLGKRCFILGNGPSLNTVDFKSLENEYVFTVNQLMRRHDFKDLKTNFHVWSDFNFFDEDSINPEFLSVMLSLNTEDNTPECFVPADFMDFARKYKLEDNLHMNYFKIKLNMYEGFNEYVDYSKVIPGQSSVVVFAIFLAIYMGFKEIYLLGCDTTGIVVSIKSIINKNDEEDYAYQISDAEQKRMTSLYQKHSIEGYAKSFWQLLCSYRIVYKYCQKRDIKLINCSSTTVIDSIPRKKLEDVLT